MIEFGIRGTAGWAKAAVLTAAIVVAGWVLAPAPGQAAEPLPFDPAFDSLFQQVLADPTNPAVNQAYADAAMQRGELRKALTAYERVLINDPNNEAARSGLRRVRLLIEPEHTTWRAEAGGRYQSNVRRQPSSVGEDDDIGFTGRLSVRDERSGEYYRWRSLASVSYDQQSDTDDLTSGLARASTGPLMEAFGDYVFRPAVGAAYSWLDGDTLYSEVFGTLSLEGSLEGAFHRAELKVAHRFVNDRFSSKDAWVVDLSGIRTQKGVLHESDALVLNARLRYIDPTGADDGDGFDFTPVFPGDYWEPRARVGYYFPAHDWLVLGATFEAYYRDYDTGRTDGDGDRHDTFYAPGAEMIFDDLCGAQCDLKLDYRFETNESNDSARDYENHAVGLRMITSF